MIFAEIFERMLRVLLPILVEHSGTINVPLQLLDRYPAVYPQLLKLGLQAIAD